MSLQVRVVSQYLQVQAVRVFRLLPARVVKVLQLQAARCRLQLHHQVNQFLLLQAVKVHPLLRVAVVNLHLRAVSVSLFL